MKLAAAEVEVNVGVKVVPPMVLAVGLVVVVDSFGFRGGLLKTRQTRQLSEMCRHVDRERARFTKATGSSVGTWDNSRRTRGNVRRSWRLTDASASIKVFKW